MYEVLVSMALGGENVTAGVQETSVHDPRGFRWARVHEVPVGTSAVSKDIALSIEEPPVDDSCRLRRAKHLEVGVGAAIGVEYTAVGV